jgi:hypothetical protein
MIEMKIESIRVSLMSPNQVVILKEVDGERHLPIFIGKVEGDAITFKMNGIEVPRPLTHDLAASVIESLGAKVSHILINDLRNQHFYAVIALQFDDKEVLLDTRPSDAIAIAVRVGCPIFVDEEVMNEAGILPESEEAGSEKDLGAFSDFISSLDLGDSDVDKDS